MEKEKIFMKSAGRRGYSPLARVMTLAVMLLAMAATAWADGKTVDFPIGNDANTGWGGSMTRNGIKIQANGSNAMFDNSHPTAIFECWEGEEYVTFTISMEDGSDILGVSMTLSGDYIGSFQNLEGWTGSEATRTWSGNAKSVNLRVNGSSEETINLEVTAISVTVPAAAEPGKYTVTMAEGTVDATNWTISPTEAAEGKPITATYTGTKHVKSVTAVKKAAAPAALTLNLTSPAVGQVIGSDGKNYAYASLPTGVTALARICYVNGSKGLAMAMADEGKMAWSAAITTCEAHTPAFANGTWKLPTKAEWDNMISASGGVSTLREAFSGIGGDNLQYVRYWSATVDESNDSNAYNIRIDNGSWATFDKTNVNRYVRAVLAW